MGNKVEIFQMLKTLYPFFRSYILDVMPDEWEPYVIPALDDLMNRPDSEASEAMAVLEWNYKAWGRKLLAKVIPEAILREADQFLDYTPA